MSGIAWIEEDLELDRSAQRPTGSLASGEFTAYLRGDTGESAGPASVKAENAITWGRANASVVIVVVCDDLGGAANFSAGAETPRDWQVGPLLPWPSGGLPEARRLANRGSEPMAPAQAGLHHVQLIALAPNGGLSDVLVRDIAERLDAADITVERAEIDHRPPDAVAQPAEWRPETFWTRPLSAPPVATWTLTVSAASTDDAEAAALRAIRSCAETSSSDALQGVRFRARAVP